MPRKKYLPKNRYCYNSNLSEEQFEFLIFCYFLGLSAAETAIQCKNRMYGSFQISSKTVARYFRRTGEYYFFKLIEPAWLEDSKRLAEAKRNKPTAEYRTLLEKMAARMVADYDDGFNYESYRIVIDGISHLQLNADAAVEFKRIRATRKGIKSTLLGDLALAQSRASVLNVGDRGRTDLESLTKLLSYLFQWLVEEPLR
jgi:hypothetical protein